MENEPETAKTEADDLRERIDDITASTRRILGTITALIADADVRPKDQPAISEMLQGVAGLAHHVTVSLAEIAHAQSQMLALSNRDFAGAVASAVAEEREKIATNAIDNHTKRSFIGKKD